MMFKAVAAFVFLLMAGTAGADDAKPAPVDALQALRADPHVAKAMEFMAASGSKDAMIQRETLLVNAFMGAARKTRSDIPDKVWDVVGNAVKDELSAGSDDFLLMSAKIYADHFSDADLDQLTAFYKSDIGVKYLRERTALTSEEAAVGRAWADRMLPDLTGKIEKKIRELTAPQGEQKT